MSEPRSPLMLKNGLKNPPAYLSKQKPLPLWLRLCGQQNGMGRRPGGQDSTEISPCKNAGLL